MAHYMGHWLQVFIDFAQTFGVLYACWRWYIYDRRRSAPVDQYNKICKNCGKRWALHILEYCPTVSTESASSKFE